MTKAAQLYTDGGVITANPSIHGGTWCWVTVDTENRLVDSQSGLVTPADIGLNFVSNNYTELLAALHGMEALPEGWSGSIYTDSQNTLLRIFAEKPKFNGIPLAMVDRVWAARRRLGAYKVNLLGGHPTKNELILGFRKDGKPVSQWNVFCDKECRRLALTHPVYAAKV